MKGCDKVVDAGQRQFLRGDLLASACSRGSFRAKPIAAQLSVKPLGQRLAAQAKRAAIQTRVTRGVLVKLRTQG
jgi:hypothetical protein